MFIIREFDVLTVVSHNNSVYQDRVIEDAKGNLVLANNPSFIINPNSRRFNDGKGDILYFVTGRVCFSDPFVNKKSNISVNYDPNLCYIGHFFEWGTNTFYIYSEFGHSSYKGSELLCYLYDGCVIKEFLINKKSFSASNIFEPINKNPHAGGLIFFDGLAHPVSSVNVVTRTAPPQSGGNPNPNQQSAQQPQNNILLPTGCHNVGMEKNCSHPNKKVVRLIQSSYLYCPDCKADLGDVK